MTEENKIHFKFIKDFLENKKRALRRKFDTVDMGARACLLYFIVHECEEANYIDIEKTLDISSARMAKLIAFLQSKGFIDKKINEKDKRKCIVFLTKEGCKKKKELENRIIEFSRRITEKVGQENIEQFMKLFTLISDAAYEVDLELEDEKI